ncbi:DUF2281 domain-containing protein [bacterium]|nr:DUF2281 domain-containing protein [bacterium]RKZ32348.1 MAG: DUF2281 domain-containing protein [bacterium]
MKSVKEKIISEIEKIPDSYLPEILSFIKKFEKKLLLDKLDTAILSESSLMKDWLKPEEDEAWKDL